MTLRAPDVLEMLRRLAAADFPADKRAAVVEFVAGLPDDLCREAAVAMWSYEPDLDPLYDFGSLVQSLYVHRKALAARRMSPYELLRARDSALLHSELGNCDDDAEDRRVRRAEFEALDEEFRQQLSLLINPPKPAPVAPTPAPSE